MSLDNKVALVTGASRGIGSAIALAYAQRGAIVGCLARSADAVHQTLRQIGNGGDRCIALKADVTNAAQLQRAIDELVTWAGALDILVANAGINVDRASVEESDVERWNETIRVNLFGVYLTVKCALPHLKRAKSAKIILIGSGTGHHARHSNSSYICSKGGLWALTQALADELRSDGITVNELIPGPVRTDMTADEARSQVMNISGEWRKAPEDVAPLAAFLATLPDNGPSGQSFSLMRRTG